jgi:hypothetical protein
MEEVERLPSDESDLKSDTEGVHNEHRVSDTDAARHSSATSSGLEKRQDVEIVDWDGPDDPENPYARQQHAFGWMARLTVVQLQLVPLEEMDPHANDMLHVK